MVRHPSVLDWVLLFFLVITWGASFVAIKVAVIDVSPAWLAAIRLIIATVLMAVFARLANVRPPRGASEWAVAAVFGVVGTALPFALINWASLYVPSGIAGLMMATNPMLVLLLAIVFLPDEQPTLTRVSGLLVGFTGVALVVLGRPGAFGHGGADPGPDFSLLAFAALAAAALGYAINSVAGRRATSMPHATRGYGALLTAAPAATILALFAEPFPTQISLQSAGATLYLAILPTWIATLVLYRLIAQTSAGFVAQSNYLVPATAILLGAVMLGETLDILQYAGFATILLGIAIAENVIALKGKRRG
ncbi:MAG TPA: DMT family transporter [Devosia sp.]|nr:DMT family transporter [Devosia sp.]